MFEEKEEKEINLNELIEIVEKDPLPNNVFTIEKTDNLVLLGKINEVVSELKSINDLTQSSNTQSITALNTSLNALSIANDSITGSATALENSQTALNTANTAISTANASLEHSSNAVNNSNTALENSQTALNTANTANNTANTAVNTANTALEQSTNAVNNSNTAIEQSTNAVNTSNTALEQSTNAVNISQNALDKITNKLGTLITRNNTQLTTYDITPLETQVENIKNYLPLTGGTISGGLDFSNSNAWVFPYLLGFKNSNLNVTPDYPITGFYQWGNEWQVVKRNSANAYAGTLFSINNITNVAHFTATPQVNGVNVALKTDVDNVSTAVNQTSSNLNELTTQFNELLNKIYPVGTIYLSINDVSPASFIGGKWEKLPDGYALWTASSGAGSTISAGIPNITGTFCGGDSDIKSGAFISSVVNGSKVGSGSAQFRTFTFNANNGASVNGIYGNSNTVQPPAYKVYAWRRKELA